MAEGTEVLDPHMGCSSKTLHLKVYVIVIIDNCIVHIIT